MEAAVDRVLTCRPDHLVLGISAESIWGGGLEPSRRIAARVKARAGDLPLTQAADALHAAFKVLGIRQKVGLLTPYFPTADKRAVHLSCPGPVEIGHVGNAELINALREINGGDIEAVVQFGANCPWSRLPPKQSAGSGSRFWP